MLESLVDPIPLAIAIAIVLGSGLLVLLVLKAVSFVEKTHEARRKFAARHGLRLEKEGRRQAFRGKVQNRPFALHQKKAGEGVVWAAELELTGGALPPGLGFGPEKVHAGWLKKAVHGQDLEIGDSEFDARVIVHADDPAVLRDYLTPARRRAVLQLVERKGQLEDGSLVILNPSAINDLEALDELLRDLGRIADVLERRPRSGSRAGPRPSSV